MLTEYIQAAMRRATYKLLDEHEGFFGEIPGLDGLWANADTLDECRVDLQGALESWILVGIWLHHEIPVIDGIDLNVKPPQEQEVA
jgi:predicted RNase H-like HicB family nuclease